MRTEDMLFTKREDDYEMAADRGLHLSAASNIRVHPSQALANTTPAKSQAPQQESHKHHPDSLTFD